MIRVVWFLLRLVLLSAVLEAAVVAEDGDDWLTADPAVAAELEQQVSAQTPGGEAPRELCVYLHKRGALLIRLGRYDEAIADFKQALALNEPAWSSADRWCVRFSIHNDLMRAVGDAGDWLTLTDHARSIAAESRSTDKWQYFAMQLRLVDAYVHLGELRQAEEALHEAADTLQGLRRLRRWDTHGANAQSQYHDSAAWLQELRGNLAEAERFRRQAMDSARQYADLMLTSFPPEHYYVQLAQRQICLRQRQLAQVLSLQGKFGEAELLARQALQGTLAHWGKNTAATAKVIGTLASIRLQQGQVGDALRLRELALTTIEKTGARPYSTDLASALREVAFLLGVQNRWPEALNLYGQRDDGLRSHAAQFAKTGSKTLSWAMALTKSQHPTEGEAMLHSLLDYNLKKPFVDPLYLAHLRGYLAVAQMTNGKYDTALGEFREAFPVLVQLAETGTNAESGGFVRRYRLRLIAEAYLDLLSRLADRGTTAGFDPVTEAFRVAEVARGSSVQQAIAKSAARATLPDPALASLARREQDTAHRIGALNNLLVRLASAPTALRLDKTIGEMRRDLEQLSLQHAEMRRELTERYSAYAELVSPRAPAPADLQKALHSDEALVAFYVAENKTYVWTITPTRATFRSVDLSRQEVDKQVATLRLGFDLNRKRLKPFNSRTAEKLYTILLAPDAESWAEARILNIVPHAALGQLPFAVLLTDAAKGSNPADWPWLLKKVAIAQQPSAGTLIALRRQGRGNTAPLPFVGFGDPLFLTQPVDKPEQTRAIRNLAIVAAPEDLLGQIPVAATSRAAEALPESVGNILSLGFSRLPALPDTADELREIGQALGANPDSDLFLGERATEANVKKTDLSAYQVVAFATHGLIPGDLRGLDQPSLAMANPALSGDEGNDGFLTMGEVLGLKLDADWVVLSACNTASGDGKSEEAVSGLGRAFFFAGSRRLLVSHWAVETVSARMLTSELFRRQARHPEESKAETLRGSMLTLLESSREYRHPAYWAPFVLVGDGAR